MDRYSSPVSRTAAAQDISRSSSVYSTQSDKPSMLTERSNGTSGGRRVPSHTYTPSFMSHHATHSTERLPMPNAASSGQGVSRMPAIAPMPATSTHSDQAVAHDLPRTHPGVLVVLIAASVPKSTISHLDCLLQRQSFSSIVLVAQVACEVAVKQLKMDVYALMGRLGKELVVAVHTLKAWERSSIDTAIEAASDNGNELHGVLCCPDFQEDDAALSILDSSEAHLQQMWDHSTAFLHKCVRAAAEKLLFQCTSCKPQVQNLGQALHGPFFLAVGSVPTTATAEIAKAACDRLLLHFQSATRTQGLAVGYAEAILLPAPKLAIPKAEDTWLHPDRYSAKQQDLAFTPSESPTKLWNMWALRNDDVLYGDD